MGETIAASPTAIDTFTEYKAKQAATLTPTTDSQVETETPPKPEKKTAPAPEPEKEAQDDLELSDDDLKKEKAVTRQRISKLLNERARTRAERDIAREEVEKLKIRLESLEKGSPRAESATAQTSGKPTLKAFTGSGRYETWEEAHEAYEEAKTAWDRQEWERDRAATSAQADKETVKLNLKKAEQAFSKAHEDYDDVVEVVMEQMQELGLERTRFSNALIRLPNAPEVIYHFGHHLEDLERISELHGDLQIAELGVTVASLKKSPEMKKENLDIPKSPKQVGARGSAPDSMGAMRQADDFRKWKQAYDGSKRQ